MTRITTEPTEVAASLVFVVQSPWTGFIVPNASVGDGDDTDVDVDALEQADTKTSVAATTDARAVDRESNEIRIPASLCDFAGASQGLSSHEVRG